MSLATFGARNRARRTRQIPRWLKVFVAAIILAVVFALFAVRYLEVYRLNREAARLVALKRSLQQENATLREEMKRLHTLEYVEKLAREQLGLVRPGEIAVLLIRQTAHPEPAPATPPAGRAPLPARIVRIVTELLTR